MKQIIEGLPVHPLVTYALAALLGLLFLWVAVRLLRGALTRRRRESLDPYKITLRDIDEMEGADFERYLYRFLSELGYEDVIRTQESKDFGADLVFTCREGYRHVLQAKRYQPRSRVGLTAVQEIYASMRYYEADRAIVLASAPYTASCAILAGVNGVKLLDRDDLSELIDAFQSGDHEEAMAIIESEPDWLESPWSRTSG
ncbi:restriction endonuclease [Paenibacillus sp. 1P07SE]|uniref:restriction endonuclease n=1 Tax=Paenibacillus sp. 1P07SE TaxID=3132209 RepID=UPI0039A71885